MDFETIITNYLNTKDDDFYPTLLLSYFNTPFKWEQNSSFIDWGNMGDDDNVMYYIYKMKDDYELDYRLLNNALEQLLSSQAYNIWYTLENTFGTDTLDWIHRLLRKKLDCEEFWDLFLQEFQKERDIDSLCFLLSIRLCDTNDFTYNLLFNLIDCQNITEEEILEQIIELANLSLDETTYTTSQTAELELIRYYNINYLKYKNEK
jgi:hypothetical protein